MGRDGLLFYILMAAFPVLQFCVFYIGVNANMVTKAFSAYDMETGTYVFNGLENFRRIFYDFKNNAVYGVALKNSLVAYLITTATSLPLSLLMSYYIFKKGSGHKLFRALLFLPSIISPLVITMIYKVMLEDALPQIFLKLFSQKVMPIYSAHTIAALLFYYLFTGFGTSVLLYSGAMSGIDPSVMEAADLDGATGLKGFALIVFPLVYPTFVTFITVGFASIFTNQLNLYSFANASAEKKYYTFGYFLYRQTAVGGMTEYPYLSAMGLIFTFIAIPLTFGARWVLNKVGPSQE